MPNNNAQPAEGGQTDLPPPSDPPAGQDGAGAATAQEGVRTDPITEHMEALKKLLGEVGVKQIIWVDDDFAVDRDDAVPEDYFGAISDQECRTLPGLSDFPEELPPEVRADKFKATWRALDKAVRHELFNKLHKLAAARGIELATHWKIAGHFAQVPDCTVRTMTLRQWREAQTGWVTSRFDGKFTLLLIDQDFGKEGGSEEGGTDILKSLQETIPDPEADKLRCALLTQPLIREEHHTWDKFATEKGLKRSRFMLISKQRLTDDQLGGFLMMLRLAILNPLCESLRTEAESVYQAALDEAKRQVAGITIYDVEQIVFASSRREGVWEPDTLFRILGMYLRRDARKLAFASPQLRGLADSVRRIAGARSLDPSPKQEGTKALEIRQLELYEDAEYLNQHFTPTDLGDIFEVTHNAGTKNPEVKRYVLIAQPCDTMVRFDDPVGERKRGVIEGTLLEVVLDTVPVGEQPGTASIKFDPLAMYRLDYFQASGLHAYVDFTKAKSVNLNILDLCAMRTDGTADLTTSDALPDGLIPSWKLRHRLILKKLGQAGDRWQKIIAACSTVEKSQKDVVYGAIKDSVFGKVFGPHTWIPYSPNRIGTHTRITFSCKRVRRFNQPWAGSLLTDYTRYLNRAAFEHDYGSIGFDVANVQPASGHEHPASVQG